MRVQHGEPGFVAFGASVCFVEAFAFVWLALPDLCCGCSVSSGAETRGSVAEDTWHCRWTKFALRVCPEAAVALVEHMIFFFKLPPFVRRARQTRGILLVVDPQ